MRAWRLLLTLLSVPQDRVRLVGSREVAEFFLSQLELGGLDRILNMMGFGGADNRRGNPRLMKDPGQGNLGVGDTPFPGNLGHMIDDLEIVFFVVKTVSKLVGFRPNRLSFIF